jgi:hypothetical protein
MRLRIEPLLYQVLVYRENDDQLCAVVESVIQSKPADFLPSAVRHTFMSLGHHRSEARNAALLSACPGITNLYLDGHLGLELLPALNRMRLERLALTAPSSSSLRFDHPMFLSVTHLDLYQEYSGADSWDNWSYLASLPVLTHLSLSPQLSRFNLPRIVAACPKIQVIVTIFTSSWQPSTFLNMLTISDARLVLMVVLDYVRDWEAGARGGVDFWARAEEFVARKRRGEISSEIPLAGDTAMLIPLLGTQYILS